MTERGLARGRTDDVRVLRRRDGRWMWGDGMVWEAVSCEKMGPIAML